MESVECFTELLVTGGGVMSECDTGHQSFTGRTENGKKTKTKNSGSEMVFLGECIHGHFIF